MPSNPLTQQELYDYGVLRSITPPAEVVGLAAAPYFPAGYFFATPYDQNGPTAWRKFHAGYISEGIIDPNRLGTGAVGDGELYLADDQTWKPVSGGNVTIRTVDSYIATEGQTDFTITAPTFDFVDVYLNGARLIPTEYSILSNVLTLNSAAELDDEIALVSYYTASLISLPKEYTLRHDFVSPYSYCGKALVGSLETQSVWTITRIQVLEDGLTTTTTATNVNWTDRLTHTYS